jgi:hypothetical protein
MDEFVTKSTRLTMHYMNRNNLIDEIISYLLGFIAVGVNYDKLNR